MFFRESVSVRACPIYRRLIRWFVKALLCWRSKYFAQKPIEKSEPGKNSEKHERMLEGEYFSTVHCLACVFFLLLGAKLYLL